MIRVFGLPDILSTGDCERQKSRTWPGFWYVQARRTCPLQIQNNLQNRFLFPNKHLILSKRFNETFCGNSLNNFDCRAFSL